MERLTLKETETENNILNAMDDVRTEHVRQVEELKNHLSDLGTQLHQERNRAAGTVRTCVLTVIHHCQTFIY